MKLVQHPHVVRLYEVIDTATRLYLVLEWGDGGDMYHYIMRQDRGLQETVARRYFSQIVQAIRYCHQLHVVHRDLKPENVVFFTGGDEDKVGVVKLTDFGFSNKFVPGRQLETSCGSLAYSAPEILLGDSYDPPAVGAYHFLVVSLISEMKQTKHWCCRDQLEITTWFLPKPKNWVTQRFSYVKNFLPVRSSPSTSTLGPMGARGKEYTIGPTFPFSGLKCDGKCQLPASSFPF